MTLRNKPNQPINVHDYTLWNQGPPRCVYVEPSQYELPEGTRTILVFNNNDGSLSRIESLVGFMSGDGSHTFIRGENWPANIFVNIREVHWTSSGDYQRVGEGSALAIAALIEDLDGQARGIFGEDFEWAEAPPSYPHIASLDTDPSVSIHNNPYTSPEPIERLLETECDGEIIAPDHIWVVGNRHKTIELVYEHGPTGTPVRLNNDGIWDHPIEDDLNADGPIVLRYFRRNRWAAGLFRLARTYRYNDDGEVLVTVQSAQPRGASTIRPRAWPRLAYPTGRGLRGRLDLNNHVSRNGVIPDDFEWITHAASSDGGGEGDRILHVTYGRSASVSIISGVTTSAPSDEDYEDRSSGRATDERARRSYYRFKEWPMYLWSGRWNSDGTRFFTPTTFGERNGGDDETTFENPAFASGNFDYQKWILFEGGTAAAAASSAGCLWVKKGEDGRIATMRPDALDAHHTAMWGEDPENPQPYLATYRRRGWWPAGIYRRLDSCGLRAADYYNVHYRTVGEEDQPGMRPLEDGVRWGSTVINDWVTALEEEIGRPIYESPDEGMPWLSFHNATFHDGGRDYLVVIDDIAIPMMPGVGNRDVDNLELARVGEMYDEAGNWHIATRYRTGLSAHFRQDAVHYIQSPPPEVARAHPVLHFLDVFRQYFVEFEDPDLVRDLAVALHERTHSRTRTWTRSMDDLQGQVSSLNIRMMSCVGQINELRRKMAYYENLDIDAFKGLLERNRTLVESQGALTYGSNHLTLKMRPFEIEGQTIGPLTIKLTTAESFGISVIGSSNLSQHGHPHPHVDTRGVICWGTGSEIASTMARGLDPLEFLFATAQFLQDGYAENDAYCKIRDWTPAVTWHCHHCNVHHPDGEPCPDRCDHCGQTVDPDDHYHCPTHYRCYSMEEYEDCPSCFAAQDNTSAASADAS